MFFAFVVHLFSGACIIVPPPLPSTIILWASFFHLNLVPSYSLCDHGTFDQMSIVTDIHIGQLIFANKIYVISINRVRIIIIIFKWNKFSIPLNRTTPSCMVQQTYNIFTTSENLANALALVCILIWPLNNPLLLIKHLNNFFILLRCYFLLSYIWMNSI